MKSELAKAVAKLVEKEPGWREFVEPQPRGALPAEVARQSASPRQSSGGSGGMGNLVETDYADRTYYADQVFSSPDGFLTWIGKPLQREYFLDDASNQIYIEHKEPPAP